MSLVSEIYITPITFAHKNHKPQNAREKQEIIQQKENHNISLEEKEEISLDDDIESNLVAVRGNKFSWIPQPSELLLVLIIINPFLLYFLERNTNSS